MVFDDFSPKHFHIKMFLKSYADELWRATYIIPNYFKMLKPRDIQDFTEGEGVFGFCQLPTCRVNQSESEKESDWTLVKLKYIIVSLTFLSQGSAHTFLKRNYILISLNALFLQRIMFQNFAGFFLMCSGRVQTGLPALLVTSGLWNIGSPIPTEGRIANGALAWCWSPGMDLLRGLRLLLRFMGELQYL